jgi:phage-related protein
MAQVCVEIGLTQLNFTGLEAAFAAIDSFKIPEMPVIPDPMFGDQGDPLAEKKEKIASLVISAIMKYFKLFILDPIEQIVNLFKDIVAAVVGIWDEIVNFELPGLGVKFMDLLTDLATQADKAIQTIVLKIKPIVDQIEALQIPKPVTVDAKNPFWEAVKKVQAIIRESVLALVKKCMDIMKIVMDKVKLVMDMIGLTFGPIIQQFFDMLAELPNLIAEGITALFKMFGAAIDRGFEAIAEMQAEIRAFITKIKTIFGIDVPGVPDIEQTLSQRASNFWKEFVVLMENWWSSFSAAVIKVFTDAMNEFLELVNAILDYVDSLVGAAKTAFINAVNAITAGLMAAITGLPAQLQKLIEGKVTFCVEVPDVPQTGLIQPDP